MNQDPNNTIHNDLIPPVVQPDTAPVVEEPSSEEPVMITANIDEMPEDQIPESILSQDEIPQVQEPDEQIIAGPELGKEEKEEVIPTFQQFADMPTETINVEETTTPVEQQSRVEIPTATVAPESYQATSQTEITAPFQQLGDIPTEGKPIAEEPEETEEEEVEDKPRKTTRVLILMFFLIILLLVVLGLIFVVIPAFRSGKPTINNKTIGDINIAVVGDVNSTKDALYVKLTGSSEDVEHVCEEESSYDISYNIMKNEIKTNKRKYNLRYPCGYSEFLKYAVLSEDLEKIDGAILVVKATDSIQPQTVEVSEVLKKAGVEKIIVFISQSDNEEDNKKVKEDVNDLLDAKGYDKTKTPIILGNIDKDQDITKLLTEADSWYKNTKYEKESYVIQKHGKVKLYTYIKKTEEGGESTPMQNKDTYSFKFEKEVDGEVKLPEGTSTIMPGDNVEVTVEFKEKIPIEKGMVIPFYKESNIVAVGVVDEIID